MIKVIHAFLILFSEYGKACESFSNLIASILGYSESIGTFIMAHNLWGGEGWNPRLWPFQNGMFNVTGMGKIEKMK